MRLSKPSLLRLVRDIRWTFKVMICSSSWRSTRQVYACAIMQASSGIPSILAVADTSQNVVGMSVVGPDFEKLKRFNLDELRQTPHVEEEASASRIKIREDE